MKTFIRLGVCAIAAAWLGCGSTTDDGATQGTGTPEGEGRLRLVFRYNDGTLAPGAVFRRKEDVHLWTRLEVGSSSFSDGELAFVVLDMSGNQMSTDALDCRRFRVEGGRGRTVEVLPGVDTDGAPCQHEWGYHDDGAVMPQLMPFADAPLNVSGLMEYLLLVARVEDIVDGTFPADAFRGTFYVLPPKEPCCGDGVLDAGEECDDGNTTSGDGCSSECTVEHEGEGQLRVTFRFADDEGPPFGVFPTKANVHLRLGLAAGTTSFPDGDLAFVVTDAEGRYVSTDALDCRRFRVEGGRARIVEVYAGTDTDGTPCQHAWGIQDNGALMPQLIPFADVEPDEQGRMQYNALVARVSDIVGGVFPPERSFRGIFYVGPPRVPCCGDGVLDAGEECDDGNTTDGDGCSGVCKQEH